MNLKLLSSRFSFSSLCAVLIFIHQLVLGHMHRALRIAHFHRGISIIEFGLAWQRYSTSFW